MNIETSIKLKKRLDYSNRKLNFKKNQFFSVIILAPLFNILLIILLPEITQLWGVIMQFFLNKLGFSDTLQVEHFHILNLVSWHVYFPEITGSMPTYNEWWAGLIGIALGFLFISLIPQNYTSLKIFLLIILFIQLSAQIYFWVSPNNYPYYLADYLRNGLLQGLILLALCPWIFVFTYYVYNHNFLKKLITTLVMCIYIILFIPLQYATHAFIIHEYSLLYMPLLYVIFGILLDVFIIIVFFSLGASWEKPNPR